MNALYTIIENGRESYYGTNIAGGYSYPFIIFGYAERMAKVLNENDPMGTVGMSEMIPLLKANENFPENVRGERLFYPLSKIVFSEREAEMSHTDYVSFSITLDFDERKIGFVFNQNCPELPAPKIEICLDRRDAREAFGKENPFMSTESFYRIELKSSVMERPVFAIKIGSDTIPETESVILPLSYRDQKELMKELETDDLDKCNIVSITAFASAFNVPSFEGQPFTKLNELASELNNLRLDCGDKAFNSFVKANKIAPFQDADSALAAVDSIRKDFALRQTQDMDIRM